MKVEKEIREREVTTTVTENVVVLELTEEEAAVLAALTSRIMGWEPNEHRPNPRRDLTDALYQELNRLGFGRDDNEVFRRNRSVFGREFTLSTY